MIIDYKNRRLYVECIFTDIRDEVLEFNLYDVTHEQDINDDNLILDEEIYNEVDDLYGDEIYASYAAEGRLFYD